MNFVIFTNTATNCLKLKNISQNIDISEKLGYPNNCPKIISAV